jgi:Holliday junction resolvase RusA-like endonuclease
MIHFIVDGPPHGKGRPRATRRGKGIRLYTDDKTVAYETKVRKACREAMGLIKPLEGPISVRIVFALPMPKSLSKKNAQLAVDGVLKPIKKPDIDNMAKSVLDGMNKIAFLDDAQIVMLKVVKMYSIFPCAFVTMESV